MLRRYIIQYQALNSDRWEDDSNTTRLEYAEAWRAEMTRNGDKSRVVVETREGGRWVRSEGWS